MAYDALDAVGERFALSTVAGFLAQTLLEQGELDAAAVVLRTEPGADHRGGHRDQCAVALRPRTHPRAARGGGRERRRSPERRSSCSRRPTRSSTRSRRASRSARPSSPAGRIDEARDGIARQREPRREEGRRRDPQRRTPPPRGSRRRPDDEITRLGHQFQGPLISDVATIVQTLVPLGSSCDRDDAFRVDGSRARGRTSAPRRCGRPSRSCSPSGATGRP